MPNTFLVWSLETPLTHEQSHAVLLVGLCIDTRDSWAAKNNSWIGLDLGEHLRAHANEAHMYRRVDAKFKLHKGLAERFGIVL